MGASNLVIKLKYGDMLRRFNVLIADDELDLNMDKLREKIISFFKFAQSSQLKLSYIDEDGDEVTLVDDDDLCDSVKQALNPLRITVKLILQNNVAQHYTSGSSTPLTAPGVEQQLDCGFGEILKNHSDSPTETLAKLLTELVSVALSYTPGITGIGDYFTKVGMSYLACTTEATAQSDVPEISIATRETKTLKLSEGDDATLKFQSSGESEEQVLKLRESLDTLEPIAASIISEKFDSTTEVIIKASSLTPPLFNTVALDSEALTVDQTVIDSLQDAATTPAKSKLVVSNVGKIEKTQKEKRREIWECYSKESSFMTSSHQPPVSNKDLLPGKTGDAKYVPTETGANKFNPDLGFNPPNIKSIEPIEVDNTQGWVKSRLPGYFPLSSSSIWAPNSSSLKPSGLFFNPSPRYECPFSGVPVENASPPPSHPPSKVVTVSGSSSQNIDSFHIFHCGIQCDVCGVHPITGPRFKSKVKVDYDLCMICFAEIGKASEYIRMDHPVVYPHHMLHDSQSRDRISVSGHDCQDFKARSHLPKLDSSFIQDVNTVDGAVLAPLTPFTKIWRMRNTGTVVWPQRTELVWFGGDILGHAFSVELKMLETGVEIEQELDVAVDCIAPAVPGNYASCWLMATPSGQKFGQLIRVLIQVDASLEAKTCKYVGDFDLNLPPVMTSLSDPEIINVIPKPIDRDSHTKPSNTTKLVESVESPVHLNPNTNLPVDNSFPVAVNEPASANELLRKKKVENEFVYVDRNDFEPDASCDISQWDCILDELFLMGFHDTKMNEKLLEKNDGSVKRVVLELIAEEKKH